MNAMVTRRAALLAGLFVPLGARAQLPERPAMPVNTNPGDPPAVGVDGLLRVTPDGRCEVLTSKTEFGQGINAALAQLVAEELDLPLARVSVPHADTGVSPDHGLTGGSLTLQVVGPRVRRAAATARAALARMGAERLGVPSDAVETVDGVVRVRAEAARSVSYAELIGGGRFDLPLDQSVALKPRAAWRVAGRDAPRPDLLDKLTGGGDFIHNLRLPGMLHARVIHAPRVGARPEAVDESSLAGIPARVVRRADLLAVVAEREWDAVRAAAALRVTWSAGTPIPAPDAVFAATKRAPVVRADVTVNRGDPAAALAAAPEVLQAEYVFGVQTHGAIGPSCAVAVFEDGRLTLHSGTQAPFDLRAQVAHTLSLSRDAVRVVYHHNAGCFGRNGLEDAASEAAVLAVELSPRPVRVQWMRHDEMRTEPKGPPMVMAARAALTPEGRIAAWEGEAWAPHSTSVLVNTTAAEALGVTDGPPGSGNWHANSNPPYDGIPAARARVHRVSETPFRPSWIRTPGRLQQNFAVESFTDELAHRAGADPVAFRLAHLTEPRGRAVIEACARAAGWEARPSPKPRAGDGPLTGRGFAYIPYDNARTRVAMACEVAVDPRSGHVRVPRVWIAQDCGTVVNPDGVRLQVEGCVIQTLSRTLVEEIAWEDGAITTLDWASYGLLRFPEAPVIETVIVERPDDPMLGAGEPAAAVVPAAVGNAIFDATGVRMRRAPMTPERVRAALSGA